MDLRSPAPAEGDVISKRYGSSERELRCTARRGEEAERQFVQSNLRLVVSIAKKYRASGLPLADIIQEGTSG